MFLDQTPSRHHYSYATPFLKKEDDIVLFKRQLSTAWDCVYREEAIKIENNTISIINRELEQPSEKQDISCVPELTQLLNRYFQH